jgi:hypothetical protein
MAKIVFNLAQGALDATPFDDDPPFAADFHQAIGRLVISWSEFERSLDLLQSAAISIANRFGSDETPLTSFNKKLEQIERIYKSVNLLDASAIKSCMPKIKDIAFNRKVLFHSSFDGYVHTSPPKIRMTNMRCKSRNRIISHCELTVAQISEISDDACSASGDISTLNLQLILILSRLRKQEKT